MTRVQLRHLPRDARDTLFSLAVVGWTIAPHAANLPAWCIALAATMLAWRAWLALTNGPLPHRWVVALVLALACGLTFATERTLLGKEAGVTMLVVLIALKTLELRARRDALVMFFLGFFLVLTHFLYSQSIGVALSMLVSAWGLLTALVLSNMPVGRPAFWRAAAISARAALLGVPMMIALFLLFPRFGPLWGMPQDAAGRTGLSGSLRLGGIANLANDDSIAFRVRFFGPPPTPDEMYFRGPVLARFDGRDWTRQSFGAESARPQPDEPDLAGPGLRYEVTLEPSRLATLPLLELTPQRRDAAPVIDGLDAWLRPDLEWATERPIAERVRFEARAWVQHRHGPRVAGTALREAVHLPGLSNPRTRDWARALRAQPGLEPADAGRLAQEVLRHVRQGGYTYTLEPGPYGADAIDEFWFDRKLGFCEHYAASFVFILRVLGVPARIVTGYQGTDPLPVDGYHVVRQSHAHAWAEYWQEGRGWVRVDPTAAVAPDRIRMSRNLAPQAGLVAGALTNLDPEFAARLRGVFEVLNNRWNQYVLNYSSGRQFDLLRALGFSAPSWQDLAYALAALLVLAASAGAGWAMWDRRRQDPWLRLQSRIQQALADLGVPVAMHHAPRARAALVREALGARGEALAALLDAMDRERYACAPGVRVDRSWWPRFEAAAAPLMRR